MKQTAVLALAAVGASASTSIFNKRQLFDVPEESSEEAFNQNIEKVCQPRNSTGWLDLNAPCGALVTIMYQCMYGPSIVEFIAGPEREDGGYGVEDESQIPDVLPNETQRDCVCQSQLSDMLAGCKACFKEHGSTDPEVSFIGQDVLDQYCKADEPATQDFFTVFTETGEDVEDPMSSETTSSSTAEATFSDPIGNKTDVSLYFTPSVTGTAAYMPAIPTPESSGANASYTSVSTSGGQIVPTAAGASSESEQSSSAEENGNGSATESDSGAVQTAMAQAGVVGAVGIAALMAAL